MYTCVYVGANQESTRIVKMHPPKPKCNLFNVLPFYKYFWGAERKSVLLFTAEAYLPVAMQVRGSRWGTLMGPHPPLCVIQSPVIGGGKEKRPTSQWLSHTVRKKELGLGTDFGNACQLMSSSLDGSFRGQCGGEVLLDRQTGSYIHALHYCIMNVYLLLLEMIIRRKTCLYENEVTLPFVAVEVGTVVIVRPLISYIFPCITKLFCTCSHETLPTL